MASRQISDWCVKQRLIPARMHGVFQLAGGLRDHYTSRADFILYAKANLTSFSRHVGGDRYWQVTR